MSACCHLVPSQPTSPAALLPLGPQCRLEDPWWGRPCPGQAPPSSQSSPVAWNSSASDPTSTEWPRAGSATSQRLRTCSPSLQSPVSEFGECQEPRFVDCTSQFTKGLHTQNLLQMASKVTKFGSSQIMGFRKCFLLLRCSCLYSCSNIY